MNLYWTYIKLTWWPRSIYLTSAAIQNTSALYGRPNLTVLFTSLKIQFNPIIIRYVAVSIQLSTLNNILKATVLKATQEIVEYYIRRKTVETYRRKIHIKNPAIFKIIINNKLVLLENAIINFSCIYKTYNSST